MQEPSFVLPINGVESVTGNMSPTIVAKMVIASMMVTSGKQNIYIFRVQKSLGLPRPSFSPESGGKVKPRMAIEEIRRQGTIRLKK